MTTDKREHEAGDEILLAGSASRTWRMAGCVLPLPAAASYDLAHAHFHSVTLPLDSSSCYTANFDPDMPGRASTKRKAISFDIKKEVIARKEKGEGNTAIGRDLGLSESSVRVTWRKRDQIHASVKA